MVIILRLPADFQQTGLPSRGIDSLACCTDGNIIQEISSAGWGDILIIDGDALIGTEIRVQAMIPQYPILKDTSQVGSKVDTGPTTHVI